RTDLVEVGRMRVVGFGRLLRQQQDALVRFHCLLKRVHGLVTGDQGEYLTWQDPGSDLGIRVELFEGRVTQMYWGTSDAIELIEGCA
ncbi:hypothetical protein, partial [Mesorhizobium sp. M8A.F.Ca.ET.207.01.1.1]|uniref:hypothetical protein n=1 Tax=Mesorhizobium sp. M8A.F.Ca.ET.207.01.1.1 TaxID=2563968 RepID=UPI001AEF26A7